jgi:hypothetical protein
MPERSPLAPFLELLEHLGLPYCITGSVAACVYGEPRLTANIDVVLLLSTRDVARLRAAFSEAEYYVPPHEALFIETSRSARGMFSMIHHATQFRADVYLAGHDPLHAWALAHRRRIDLEGTGAWIAPPEYVVLRKLEFLREGGQDKHIRDIRFILAATTLDLSFVEAEVARLGLRVHWLQCRAGNMLGNQ